MLNVNEPETRGMALALQTMLDDLGKGGCWAALISLDCCVVLRCDGSGQHLSGR